MDEVASIDPFIVPNSIFDEVTQVCSQLGIPLRCHIGSTPTWHRAPLGSQLVSYG